jgi:hypothetical protein
VDLSGIIFVLLAVAWAVFLIPKALRHHDEAARTRSIDTFSTSVRVVAHREPVNDRDTRLVVPAAKPRSTAKVSAPAAAPTPPATPAAAPVAARRPAGHPEARRKAARKAARRRRRILTFLLLCDVAVGVAAYLAYAPLWSVAVPAGFTLVYLVLCRTQVRSESVRDQAPAPRVVDEPAVVEAEEPAEQQVFDQVDEHRVADFDDAEDTMGIEVAELRAAVASSAEPGALWDPLPVTLPTYVTKAKASRTVRTIDLGEPGTWTSGRTAEDADIVAQAADAQAATEGAAGDGARAVGS